MTKQTELSHHRIIYEEGRRQREAEILEDELKFLQSPIKETSKNWVKERITEIKQKLEDLK